MNLARQFFSHYFLCNSRFARFYNGLMRRLKRCKTGSISAKWAKLVGVKASTLENDEFYTKDSMAPNQRGGLQAGGWGRMVSP